MLSEAPAIETALRGFVLHQALAVLCALWAGIFMGAFLAIGGLLLAGRLMSWWATDDANVKLLKAGVACLRVPEPERRKLILALRQAYGEGPFREWERPIREEVAYLFNAEATRH